VVLANETKVYIKKRPLYDPFTWSSWNMENKELTFNHLVDSIRHVHKHLAAQAGRAVNISLTMRNWGIGYYIREYEQNGADRARYGDRLLGMLSERLTETGMEGMAPRSLRLYRQFYLTYPEIWQTVSAESLLGLSPGTIWQSLSAKSAAGTLCTRKDNPLVEYALAGMDNQLFVSKYQLELPKKEDIERFLADQIKEVGQSKWVVQTQK